MAWRGGAHPHLCCCSHGSAVGVANSPSVAAAASAEAKQATQLNWSIEERRLSRRLPQLTRIRTDLKALKADYSNAIIQLDLAPMRPCRPHLEKASR